MFLYGIFFTALCHSDNDDFDDDDDDERHAHVLRHMFQLTIRLIDVYNSLCKRSDFRFIIEKNR